MGLRADVLRHMDEIAERTKADVFLCNPKPLDLDSASIKGNLESSIDNRFRIVIFGDMEVCEHAKTRLLIMIDQIVRISFQIQRGSTLTCPTAWKKGRHDQARAFTPHPHLRQASTKHQAHRVSHEHRHLLSASLSHRLWLFPRGRFVPIKR